jgi:hypothetical protein
VKTQIRFWMSGNGAYTLCSPQRRCLRGFKHVQVVAGRLAGWARRISVGAISHSVPPYASSVLAGEARAFNCGSEC